ncbi:MAG: Efflux transporter, family, subunit [Verrucomicrobiales bacterium]|nr:Efflux transporter, family, subunit [Verrucomicrobiales bacterium]
MKSRSLLSTFCSLLFLAFAGCTKTAPSAEPHSEVAYYTCSMHPSVHLSDPKAKCPICGMNLTPVKARSTNTATTNRAALAKNTPEIASHEAESSNAPPTEFNVPLKRQQQIGVTYASVRMQTLTNTLRAVGVVDYDKQRHWDYVSRIEGYVHDLKVFSRGESVARDQALLTIYSPELLTTEREFLNVLQMREEAARSGTESSRKGADQLYEASKNRLRLWNINEKQIADLENSRVPKETLTLYSPFAGVVQTLGVDQGRRVMMGDHLVDVVDLSKVWVWAEFYQEDLSLLKKGGVVEVRSSSYPGEVMSGTLSIIDPFIADARRTVRVRIDLDNKDLRLRPEMYVDVKLSTTLAAALTVPVSAIMPTGLRNIAFVEKPEGSLEPRLVELGRKVGDDYIVDGGLRENERVVSSANFLIDAEAKLQGALKSW